MATRVRDASAVSSEADVVSSEVERRIGHSDVVSSEAERRIEDA
jgi:hypothetical protein